MPDTTLAQDLRRVRQLKDAAEASGKNKKEDDVAFKIAQAKALDRMEAEESLSFRAPATEQVPSYLYSVVTKVKGQIEDRGPYVRWCLENDEAIIEFLRLYPEVDEQDFYDAIMGTSQVSYKEDGTIMNQQANAHVDDGAPLPPGLTFRPAPYISMTKS